MREAEVAARQNDVLHQKLLDAWREELQTHSHALRDSCLLNPDVRWVEQRLGHHESLVCEGDDLLIWIHPLSGFLR